MGSDWQAPVQDPILRDGQPIELASSPPLPRLERPPKRSHPFLRAIGSILLGLALLLLAVGVWANFKGNDSHDLTGVIELRGSEYFYAEDGNCVGMGGFNDLVLGAPVTVRNEKNEVIATGKLDMGIAGTAICRFQFSVADVPNANYYQIEVSHRGGLTYSKSDLERTHYAVQFAVGG